MAKSSSTSKMTMMMMKMIMMMMMRMMLIMIMNSCHNPIIIIIGLKIGDPGSPTVTRSSGNQAAQTFFQIFGADDFMKANFLPSPCVSSL
jgi:hypothetical protein